MLDDDEYVEVDALIRAAMKGKGTMSQRFAPLIARYRALTGVDVTRAPIGVAHHRLSLLGPGCAQCSKPLRSPQAAFCAACGHPRDA